MKRIRCAPYECSEVNPVFQVGQAAFGEWGLLGI
jgi:hypothetical protein